MVLHNLSPAIGSRGKKKRKGRGQGSGKGGTSTKGHKGQQSRSGYRIGGEGGQTKIEHKTPKSYFRRNKAMQQELS
ncbi:MAG: uL15 family ribosomal protein, partial [Cytophagales bacterium]